MINFEQYFKALQEQRIDEITEHSHRSNLQQLLESFASSKTKILHEPKREGKFGSPDFKITQVESIIGYVENKKIEENLDKILKTDQIKKYQALSDNILITNYIEWIWIKEGKIQQRETLCFLTDIEDKRKKLDKDKVTAVEKLIKSFFSEAPKEIADAKKLAEALAIRARLLKDFLLEELQRQEKAQNEGRLFQLYETFKSFVFHELKIDEFADTFAQNLVYGLFLAKLNADTQPVNLYNAKKYIPASFELIRELVNFLNELDNKEYRETKWIVEEILTIMNNLNLRAIQESLSFAKKKKDKDSDDITIKDPYVYFYEDFLASYDKQLRKSKGVYYTPPPIVNFIVRSIDDILKKSFNIKDGLADRTKVTVLDFATGTGTFLVEVLQQIFDNLPKDSGKKDLLIKEHILKNIFGFEYLIAPYTIAHLKLSQFLKDNGYVLKENERLQIFLTNTLDPIDLQQKIPLLPALTEESKQAQQVKDRPILIITGNPPYSINSKNNGDWIKNKIADYRMVDGKRLNERNPKGLQDDYVKFIRFAQDKMDSVEEGIVGIITNHSYLDNPTFRGMRQSLINSFNQIYIIDLHGNSDKKEVTPEGNKDENVFDIQSGVTISIFIKKKGLEKKILHTDFWGLRNEKYLRSSKEKISTIEFNTLYPSSPFYLFKPQNNDLQQIYTKWTSLKEIFLVGQEGVKTHRDHFVIDTDKFELEKRIKIFIDENYSDNEIAEKLNLKSTSWNLSEARKKLQKVGLIELKKSMMEIQYRPFDDRIICLRKEIVDRPRETTMQHMMKKNIGLITTRFAYKKHLPYNYIFVTKNILDVNQIQSPGSAQLFPLYLYINYSLEVLKESNIKYGNTILNEDSKKTENFTKEFRDYIDKLYKKHYSPEEIFGYIYAILYSPTFRKKYAEYLKIDFPRIPFIDDKKVFDKLSKLGNELIESHLLEAEIDIKFGDFIGRGSNIVEHISYSNEKQIGKIYINKTQYFNDVPLHIWEFQIGGYQVVDKFLKERKNKELSIDEVERITSIVNSIAFSIEQMKKIDNLTKNWI